jgi:hypothetical protein
LCANSAGRNDGQTFGYNLKKRNIKISVISVMKNKKAQKKQIITFSFIMQ